ncbi:C3a anaphylatoxin chemotactic receptor-like [Gastrophryne carolinensis]
MKTIMAVWFLNLAIADFMCCAFLPVRIAEWVLFDYNNYPIMLCLFSSCILILSMCSSVYFLTIISIDRCLSIVWPIRTRLYRTLKIARIISGIIWAVSIILSAPFVTVNLRLNYSDCAPKGYQLSMSHFFIYVKILRNIRLAFMFVIPLTIIFVSYSLIFFKLRKLMKRQRSHQCYRTVISVVVCFFVCWFPYYIWPYIPTGDANLQIDNLINEIFITLAYFNSCINPILYVFFCQDFKENFFGSIPARLERALIESS